MVRRLVATGLMAGSGLGLAAISLIVTDRPAAADTGISIVLPTLPPAGVVCPGGGLLFCFSPQAATGVAGVPIRWTNTTPFQQAVVSDDGGATFNTGEIAPGGGTSPPVILPAGTYTYHDADHPDTTGSLTISGAGGSLNVPAGQTAGQVTGAGAGKPKVVAAAPPAPVITVIPPPPGSHALPPLSADATPGSDALPPVSPASPSATPRPRELASAPASGGTERSPNMYLIGGLIFLVIASAGGSYYGLRWWRRKNPAMPTGGSPGT